MANLANQHFNRSGISKLPCAITQCSLPPTHSSEVETVSLDQDKVISFKLDLVWGFYSPKGDIIEILGCFLEKTVSH